MDSRTYFDRSTGRYLGSWNWPPTPEQSTHPAHVDQPFLDGQVGSGDVRLNLATMLLEPLPPPPDYTGFLHWLDANLAFAQIQALCQLYGMFIAWCQFGNAPRIQECILDARTNHSECMTPVVYAMFQQAVQDFHLPVALP